MCRVSIFGLYLFSVVALLGCKSPEYKSSGGFDREYYCRLKDSAWKLYDEQKDYAGATACLAKIYKWSHAMTNEVLRYKSAGGIAYIYTEQIEHQALRTNEDRERCLRRCDASLKWADIVMQIDDANISGSDLTLDDKEDMKCAATECIARVNTVKDRISNETAASSCSKETKQKNAHEVAPRNPYGMTIPLGAMRGLATAVMSPCDLAMAWPFAFENGDFMIFGLVPTFGFVVSAGYMFWDVGFGVVDFCSLGYAGNKWYDEETSPWWWQRFSGKRKAAVFR